MNRALLTTNAEYARAERSQAPSLHSVCKPLHSLHSLHGTFHKGHGDAALARGMETGAAQLRFLDGVALSATALRPKEIAA